MRTWGLRAAVVGLVWMAGTASAGDPRTLASVVEEQGKAAAEEAKSLDALAAAGDLAGWTTARERYLARLESARATVEEALSDWVVSAKPDSGSPKTFLPAMELAKRLGEARLVYRVLTERVVKGADDARKAEFTKMDAGLATRTLEKGLEGLMGGTRRRGQMIKSVDNLRTLVLFFISSEVGLSKPWPPYSGKRLVLWLVATNKLDRRDPRNLEVLFSPGDSTRSVDKAGGAAAFAAITLTSLKSEGTDLTPFTSYAGRANADSEHRLTAEALEKGAPLFADLSFGDVAIVAFTNGAAKILTKKELGLEESDPLVAGPTSKAEVLRHLSDK